MRKKTIALKENSGQILEAVFSTKSLNLYVSVKNTINPFCVGYDVDPPVATVAHEDIEDERITVRNLNLGDCFEGDLFADFELNRGIKQVDGTFTH